VVDSVADGVIPEAEADNLLIIASIFIEWDAADKKIYDWNYEATKTAIRRAIAGEPAVGEVLAQKDTAKHPFA
jgi:5,6,7,8-tetrahydromethanopterin hydro-lyase